MAFVKNAAEIAHTLMAMDSPRLNNLAEAYQIVISFLVQYPNAASQPKDKGAPAIGTTEYIEKQAHSFALSRNPKAPQEPATVPDEMVSVILNEYFGVPASDLERIKKGHSLSMGAENLVGDLLERYLAKVLEPQGWIWCSGSMVKAVDFIKPPSDERGLWRMLQVKNRDNSENSSSSAIRDGTTIEKWFRTFSKKVGSNWTEFPDTTLRQQLSEEDFKIFVRQYLKALKP